MVLFRFAAAAAFLIFFRAADLCFCEAIDGSPSCLRVPNSHADALNQVATTWELPSAGFLAWNLCTLFASFGEPDSNGLLSALDAPAFSSFAGAQRSFFLAVHCAFD